MKDPVTVFSREFRTFNLDHDTYCVALGECRCTEHTVRVSAKSSAGGTGLVEKRLAAPAVLTLLAGQKTQVERAALGCQEMKAAIARREVRVFGA